ncbi:dynein regulatory complex subunit 2-like isoform X3 [Saccopteryx bilineata]|uniref:dynein regulatory complex subunit 2-like isoform X3 n=1 Tax=Saccopteryx bilineata TaxID=59482 RepID=UPI00338F569B
MSKKGKKAKTPLSPEEQLLLFQQKVLAEEETAKKRERLLSQFLKDKLAKEENSSALNLNKINTQWRTVLREVKTRELQTDIEILSQTFERVVDCKDNVIRSLAKDLSEAEEQHAHALRSHLHNIDQLLALQRGRLNALEENYNMELETLAQEFETERKTIVDQHEKEIRYLQDLFMAMEQNHIDSEYESKLEFQSLREDLKNKTLEEKHFLRLQQENVVEDLWARFQDALKRYTDATEDRKVAFEALKVKDEKSSKEIGAQMKRILRLQDSIVSLKDKIATHSRESEEQNQHIREDKELALAQLRKLKTQRTQARRIAQGGLVKLTLESDATLKALRKTVDKVTADYTGMENFWKRYNKVRLEQLSLQCRRAQLAEVNDKLRETLKQYLNGISVSEEVLSQPNPLLMVNYRSSLSQSSSTPTAPPGRAADTAPNVVEAAHVTSHSL